jgi:aldehyde dehydrogenase (NAD+)
MQNNLKFYINGEWIDPAVPAVIDVINPATEQPFTQISAGSAVDIDRAVVAARAAFNSFSQWSVKERLDLLERIRSIYKTRFEDIAQAISNEMGAPIDMSRSSQTVIGMGHIKNAITILKDFEFETIESGMILRHEAIGVCGLITPWNWPMNQVASKVMPALAVGCTMVLKPSEESPIDSMILAEVLHEAGVPPSDIDMMSFTGSTRGGIAVAKASADTVKRVGQELGGKSANIILDDIDIATAVADGIDYCMDNTGQSCNAPTRMLVPNHQLDIAIEAARVAANKIEIDDPAKSGNHLGPVVNKVQFDKIQGLIQVGIDEGATLVAGGTGRPDHLSTGYYVKPTVFAHVNNNMTIAREEIFGPVIAILGYEDEEEAIAIANDTDFGLAGYISSGDMGHATAVARRIRAGQIAINYKGGNSGTPFGGYKQSGNGREKGRWGLLEFLEVKAITGIETD